MREPRIFTEQPLQSGRQLLLESVPSRHLLKVLRLKADAPLRLFNGDGREFHARLIDTAKQGASVEVRELAAEEPEVSLKLGLFIGISKGERMDFAIQKAVELGVTRIQPLFTKRSMVQLKGERLARRMDHWRSVIVSACEQSGRCRLPLLGDAVDLPTGLAESGAERKLVLYHRGETGLHGMLPPCAGVDLLIGPEGGLDPTEIDLAQRHGYTPVRLGPRVMRTETAPIAALAAIQTLWGDFRDI